MVRAVVVVPVFKPLFKRENVADIRDDTARLQEALGLARAIDLDVVGHSLIFLDKARPATLLGSGKVEEIAAQIKEGKVELVIIDHALTPIQQRNLEKAWDAKVIDRTGLILEIFGARARTKEGSLQVELAHLNYQKGRLVRSWTHLERQRGGGGFLGGPGETQIEADRRILQGKINRIERELEAVVRTRKLHRAKRQKTPHPVVALVGYTNAGKSTLFNKLTGADVLAQDMLFATLDPTLRCIRLAHGTDVILSDTVGFISNLPTHLVAAFRATLEEVIEADLILHVCDISDPNHKACHGDVVAILTELGIKAHDPRHIIEVWNKIDLLEHETKNQSEITTHHTKIQEFYVSSVTGEGLDFLIEAIEQRLAGDVICREITLSPHEMALLDWLYRHMRQEREAKKQERGQLLHLDDGGVVIEVALPQATWLEFEVKRKKYAHEKNKAQYN